MPYLYQVPDEISYMHMVAMPAPPADFGEMWPFATTAPVFMDLTEWHCISPGHPVAIGGEGDGFDDGVRNGWFPEGTKFRETWVRCGLWPCGGGVPKLYADITDVFRQRGLEVSEGNVRTEYERWVPGQRNSHNEETCRICTSARCEERYGAMDVDEEGSGNESEDPEEDQEAPTQAPVHPCFGLEEKPLHTPAILPAPEVKLFDAESIVTDGEDDIECVPCRGIGDIIITGNVRSPLSMFCSVAHALHRRSIAMVRRGTITSITGACESTTV